MSIYNGIIFKKNIYNGQKVKKWTHNGVRVFTAGSTVTYYVDSGTSYTEEVDSEASCLSPTSFTPTKSGWSFVGWREDTTASSSVLSSKIMGDSPITLYAVFRKAVTVTYYNNSTTAKSTSGYRYYNNGNIVNPSFALTQASKSGWSARGWSTGTAGNSGITYNNATAFTRDSSITLYGMYQKTITCTFISYNSTQTSSGIRYYNSNGNVVNANVTVPTGSAFSGWSWRGWSAANDTTGNGSVAYANGSTISNLSTAYTYYGLYQKTITVTYYHVSNPTAQTASGIKYYNSNGNVVDPAFTLSPAGFGSEWTFRGWTTGTSANAGVTYSSISNRTFSSNITLYELLQKPVTLSYNGNGATSGSVSSQTGYVYLNSYGSNTVSHPSFTLPANGFAKTDYTFAQWRVGSTSGTAYAPGTTITLSSNTTVYAEWFVSSLVVYSATTDGTIEGTSVNLHNTNYVGVPESIFEASMWYRLGTDTKTKTINISYGRYTKATISYMVYVNNTSNDRTVSLKINGSEASTVPLTYPYTYNTSDTAVTMELSATNNDHAGTWVWIKVCVTNITLSV